jgi:hypothetical protein
VALRAGNFTASVFQEASGNVCLEAGSVAEGIGIGCAHAADAARSGITLLSSGVGQATRITALVPDGVSTITASAGNTQLPAAVTNNVATAVLSGIDRVSYTLPSGEQFIWTAPPPPHLPSS